MSKMYDREALIDGLYNNTKYVDSVDGDRIGDTIWIDLEQECTFMDAVPHIRETFEKYGLNPVILWHPNTRTVEVLL